MEKTITVTHSAEETAALGAALAKELLGGSLPHFVALYGDLGVGKTAFVRGMASVMAKGARVLSPTFALVHEYKGTPLSLFHFDMYRITGEDDLYSIGYDDYLNRHGVCVVEWSENIPFALPGHFVKVTVEKNDPTDENCRSVTMEEVLC